MAREATSGQLGRGGTKPRVCSQNMSNSIWQPASCVVLIYTCMKYGCNRAVSLRMSPCPPVPWRLVCLLTALRSLEYSRCHQKIDGLIIIVCAVYYAQMRCPLHAGHVQGAQVLAGRCGCCISTPCGDTAMATFVGKAGAQAQWLQSDDMYICGYSLRSKATCQMALSWMRYHLLGIVKELAVW